MGNRPGLIRLHALPSPDVWHAAGALALYLAEPRSILTVTLAVASLTPGDIAGLVLSRRPYAWFGVERGDDGLAVAQFDERSGTIARARFAGRRVWLQADYDSARSECRFRYSTDGRRYAAPGGSRPVSLPDGVAGVACSLFSCSLAASGGEGYADFHDLVVTTEPHAPDGTADRD